MKQNTNNTTPIIIMLSIFMALDLMIIIGILIHGKANFVEVFKHLN